ncbi:unnamed protein product [Prorocentrum cordatum]|uniref:ABC transporter domain-containing protein n=1 Tax=Prorocentrum cordatum TaxID=2364126 RepID=A0ABN9S622_9DINO|nr:unnamed protein product [Polarella glacialis]
MECPTAVADGAPWRGAAAGGATAPRGGAAGQYGAAPRQSLRACMRVLLRKHLVLGWRRGRVGSILGWAAVIVFVPLMIWSQLSSGSEESARQILCMSLLPLLGVLLMLGIFTQFVVEVVTDKELKMRYVQQVAGVSTSSYWLSYYSYYFFLTTFCAAVYLICVMAIAPFYKHSNGLLMLLVILAAFLQTFFVAMMISAVLCRARTASVVCGMIGALTVVFSYVVLPQISSTSVAVYLLEGLIPFVAPLNLLNAVGALEATGRGLTFGSWGARISASSAQTGSQQVHLAAGAQLLILLVDTVIYGLLATWLDQVYQGEFGAALPWNFCLRPAYLCPGRRPAAERRAEEESGTAPALELDRLVKVFGKHRAVDGMSLEVRRGEIFALLGHNGAGKTTAINCITGMLPATSGVVRVCGVDVSAELQEARRHLSVCPQDNPLYLEFSVDEHLAFFAALRGVPPAQAQQEIDAALVALGLTEKRAARVQTLSGGQKRRLWVATSILGTTPVVFLDEPTSGMDPANRRKLWDMLVQMKNRGRTVLFTTHYLDEADVLAQRKAVLDKGKVCVVGTSMDLKHTFGVGYHLRVVGRAAPEGDRPPLQEAALCALVRQHVPSASQEAGPGLLRAGGPEEGRRAGQSCFVLPYREAGRLGQLLQDLEGRAEELGVSDYVVEATSLEEVFLALGQGGGGGAAEAAEAGAAEALSLASPSERVPVTWSEGALAVFLLRWRQVLQRKRSLCATFLVPLALMVFTAWSSARPQAGGDAEESQQGLTGAGIGMTMTVCLAIALPYFATVLVVDRSNRCTYTATSQGLPWSAFWAGTLLSNYLHFLLLALVTPVGLAAFQAPFYGEPERLGQVLPAVLWAPVPMLLFAYSVSRLFSSAEACSKFMPGVSLLASVLPFLAVYIMALLGVVSQTSAAHDCERDLGDSDVECQAGLDFGKTMHRWAVALHWLMSFVDPYYCLPGTFLAIGLSSIPDDPVPGLALSIDVGFPAIAGSAPAVPLLGSLAISALLALSLTCDAASARQALAALRGRLCGAGRSIKQPGLGKGGASPAAGGPGGGRSASALPDEEESGVAAEEQRVATTDPGAHAVAYRGLVHTYNAGSRREVRAVRGISLAVGRGECFTLLGPNGAGKTTTLDALTGAICPPTAGEVSIGGHSLAAGPGSRLQALSSLGNCPQVDPLWPSLTGRQHLLFYARVKGLPAHLRAPQADALLRALGFSAFDADKCTQGYSGGMKRKLSLAIALIGSPPTLLLDEPSAAVDAAAKRHLWRVVQQRERSQTVILTTHSMEEAEALSDRLAIQVRGRLRCVGTPDHIKSTYGAGYQLELLVGGGLAGSGPAPEVERFVAGLCPAARLLEHHEGRYLFQLPLLKAVGVCPGELSVARLFLHMQGAPGAIGLQDYSISRPSLEQVFLRFSREQEEAEAEAAASPRA